MICADKDTAGIETKRHQLSERARHEIRERLIVRQVDFVKEPWPFGPRTLGGVVNIQCFLPSLLRPFEHSLVPGGYFCIDTAQGHGGNYLDLPRAGQLRKTLEEGFEFELYEERPVGPANCGAVAVRLLARKRRHVGS